jgi:hypothetical protein
VFVPELQRPFHGVSRSPKSSFNETLPAKAKRYPL